MNSKSITPNQIIGATIIIAVLAMLAVFFVPKMFGSVPYTQDHWNRIAQRVEEDKLEKATITVRSRVTGEMVTVAVNLKDIFNKTDFYEELTDGAKIPEKTAFVTLQFSDGETVVLNHEKSVTFSTVFEHKRYTINNQKLSELISVTMGE